MCVYAADSPWIVRVQFMVLPSVSVTFEVASVANSDGSVDITVSSTGVAVYVSLTTAAAGRFSDNGFFLVPPSKVIRYIPFTAPADIPTLTSTLRVEHLAQYTQARLT